MSTTFNYWSLVLDTLKSKVSASNFQSFIAPLEFLGISADGRKITLSTLSEFHKNYLKKFEKDLLAAINKYYPNVIHLDYSIRESSTQASIQEHLNLAPLLQNTDSGQQPEASLPAKSLSNLNPKYSFETFVVTRNLEFVHQVVGGVLEEPGTLYSPLFIHSSVGLGKTHILQAVGHRYLEKKPSQHIKYVTSESLFNQFYFALSKKKVDEFREYYSDIDLLLIDDIQFISGKEGFQEIFFHLFNVLHQKNKQIILTSDRSPKELVGVADRLVSRFESGLVIDIPFPDIEDRLSILKEKARRLGLNLENSVLVTLATVVNANVRELEGVLNKIRAISNQNPDYVFTSENIAKMFRPVSTIYPQSSTSNHETIINAIAASFGIEPAQLVAKGREKTVALARQIACYLFKTELKLSYPHIGKLLGGRDHTTILHSFNKIKTAIDMGDIYINTHLNQCKQLLSKK